ncbi:MAG: M3 family oligoendopeptidase [Fimbriimonadales bacterium]
MIAETNYNTQRWDLSALFSGLDDPNIEKTLNQVEATAKSFAQKYKGKISSGNLSASELGAAVKELEEIANTLSKPLNFAELNYATDTGNAKCGAFLQQMMERASEIQVVLMFFELELQSLDKPAFDAIIADPSLRGYLHWAEKLRTYSPYRLSEPEEVILEKTANTGARAWVRLHDELTSNHEFPYTSPSGEKQTLTLQGVLDLLRHSDRNTRQAAADSLSAGLKQLERPLVYIYNTLLQDKKVDDQLRSYEYPEQSRHLANELDKQTVDLVVEMCAKNFGLVSRFYNVKRQILGLSELTHIDRYAPLFEADEKVTFEKGKEIVLSSFGRFSQIMSDSAEEFFDKNWIDAEPRPGKTSGAFCASITPDTHPVVLMSYMDKMDDVMTLAHELGHGVHGSFSRRQSYFNFHTTLPLAELASTFGEMLVFDTLVANATTKDKVALYAEKIEGIFATIFRQAAMFRFEQACHAHRRQHGELSADEFGELWHTNIQAMFGSSVLLGEQHKGWWSYIGHFIFMPFYVYAYSFGELLVLSLYQKAKSEGASFAEKYVELLSLGGSKTPIELMQTVGVDLHDELFWKGGFDELARLLDEFEKLWNEYSATK